jgi:type III secretion protein X
MSNLGLNTLSFDRGIETITYARQDAQTSLPERGEAPPPETGVRDQLSALLDQPTIDSYLDGAIGAPVVAPDMLVPGRFQGALESLTQRLATMGSKGEIDTDSARLINRAQRVLGQESELRSLVAMYRSVMYQG